MPGLGIGVGQPTPPKKREHSGPEPSNKVKLIEGVVPTYQGDITVPLVDDKLEPVIVTIMSEPGLGKTHIAMGFPDVAICDTEYKGEKIWKKYYRGEVEAYRIEDGKVVPYKWDTNVITPSNSRLSHAENWGQVAAFYDHYVKDPDIQTLVFDSETDLREMAELWTLGEIGKSTLYGGESGKTTPYSLAFGKLRYILYNAKRQGKHLVYTAKVKDEYNKAGNKTGKLIHDGYSKQFFYSGYVIMLRLGVVNSTGETLYKKHVFGEIVKCENMKPGFYPPYLIDCSFRGIVEELVRGKEWTQTLDDFIREEITPRMDDLGVLR